MPLYRAVCLDLVSSGNCLVSSLQTAGHTQLGFQVEKLLETVYHNQVENLKQVVIPR